METGDGGGGVVCGDSGGDEREEAIGRMESAWTIRIVGAGWRTNVSKATNVISNEK